MTSNTNFYSPALGIRWAQPAEGELVGGAGNN